MDDSSSMELFLTALDGDNLTVVELVWSGGDEIRKSFPIFEVRLL